MKYCMCYQQRSQIVDYLILNKLDTIHMTILLAEMSRVGLLDNEQYKKCLLQQFELVQKIYNKDEKK